MVTLPISGRHSVPRYDFGVPADAGIHLDLSSQCRARSTRHSMRRLGVQGRRRDDANQARHAQASRLAAGKSRPLANQPVALKRLADLQAA
jgi:hypothetical protein